MIFRRRLRTIVRVGCRAIRRTATTTSQFSSGRCVGDGRHESLGPSWAALLWSVEGAFHAKSIALCTATRPGRFIICHSLIIIRNL